MKRKLVVLMIALSLCLWGCSETHTEKESEEVTESMEEDVIKEEMKGSSTEDVAEEEMHEEEQDESGEEKETENSQDTLMVEQSSEEQETASDEPISDLPFFFPEGTESVRYQSDFSENEEAEILVIELKRLGKGILYQLKIRTDGSDSYKDVWDIERFNLGYFLVIGEKIYHIDSEDADKMATCKTEEELIQLGTMVCQSEDKPDPIEGEKGWHEYIEVKGNRCEFHSWNDLTETGFYEGFVWERGKGLIQYRSGYGAMADHIEVNILSDM